MVPASTLFCALCRSVVEQPIEYAKVMGQTNKTWVFRDVYRGFGWQVYIPERESGSLQLISSEEKGKHLNHDP